MLRARWEEVRMRMSVAVVTKLGIAVAALTTISPVAIGAPATSPAASPRATLPASAKQTATSITRFGFDLFARIRKAPGNACVSPLSIAMALGVAHAGAGGATAGQMSATLHLGPDAATGFPALRHALTSSDTAYTLTIANALWVGGTTIEPKFLARARSAFGAEVTPTDFASPGQASDRINAWVAAATRGRITGIISPGAITPTTRLVITNAVYFRGRWEQAFDPAMTSDEDFASRPGTTRANPFMHLTRPCRYAEDDRLQVLELPYAHSELRMVLILPKTESGRDAIERALNPQQLNHWVAAMHERPVEIHLPRFRIETDAALEQELPAMGMADAFDPGRADFSGIDGRHDLFIGAVRHRTFVEVEETGTTAAAATGVIMPTALIRPATPPVVFRADHPFLFLIRDAHTGVVLFLGRVEQPES
jgi:serpin B